MFAGALMECCGMSHALVNFARAPVGWLRRGLGVTVIVVSFFFVTSAVQRWQKCPHWGSILIPSLKTRRLSAPGGALLISSAIAMDPDGLSERSRGIMEMRDPRWAGFWCGAVTFSPVDWPGILNL